MYKHNIFRKFFIRLGLFQNRMENRINKSTVGNKIDDFFIKAITDEIALEKGIEFFWEIFLYSFLIGLPCYEMYTSSQSEKKK